MAAGSENPAGSANPTTLVEDVRRALVMSTCSTRFVSLNYWVETKTGFNYLANAGGSGRLLSDTAVAVTCPAA